MQVCTVNKQNYFLNTRVISEQDPLFSDDRIIDPPTSEGPYWQLVDGIWEDRETYQEDYIPRRISKADFQRLFAPPERYALNALKKQISTLSAEDYSNPANTLLVAAEDVMFAFEQPLEFIELNHPETYQGLMLLSYLGILTEARVNEIVTVY